MNKSQKQHCTLVALYKSCGNRQEFSGYVAMTTEIPIVAMTLFSTSSSVIFTRRFHQKR